MSENNVGILSAPNGDGANIKIENDKIIINKDLTYSPDENTNIDLISKLESNGYSLIKRDKLNWHSEILENINNPYYPIKDFNTTHTQLGICGIKWDWSTLNCPTYDLDINPDNNGLMDGIQEVKRIPSSGYISSYSRYFQEISSSSIKRTRKFFRIINGPEASYVYPWHEYVILSDSYVSEDGNSWYRKYSDGWIEQGGKAFIPTAGAAKVTFLIEYTETNYNIQATNYDPYLGTSEAPIIVTRDTTFIEIDYKSASIENTVLWYACGY